MSGSKPWVSWKSVSELARAFVNSRRRRSGACSTLLALAVLTLATLGLLTAAEASQSESRSIKLEDDEESDNAPFAVVVQHDMETGTAWFCGGSLVSSRTALTSRWCARGRELWLLAAALLATPRAPARMDGVRRVARVVFANELGGMLPGEMDDGSDVISDDAWSGASLDIALLELESPFGSRASVRPILMATASSDCGFPHVCHVAGMRGRSNKPLVRIVDLDMARGDLCSDIARHWAAVRDYVFCLSGNELCRSDRGAGVVCSGKLCGVVSRSARAGLAHGTGCGNTHAAQSVARWRRFVQCSHTAGSCARDTECTELCMERQLLPEAETSPASKQTSRMVPPPPTPPRPLPDPTMSAEESTAASTEPKLISPDTEPLTTTSITSPYIEQNIETTETRRREKARGGSREHEAPTRSDPPQTTPASSVTPDALAVGGSVPMVHPPRMEYDPSRADFKAGEYGDNAADYAGLGEDAAGASKTSASGSPSSAPSSREPSRQPTRSRPPKSTKVVPPTAENQAAAEFFPGDSFSRIVDVTEKPSPEPVAPVKLTAANSASTKRLNILYSNFYFIPLFMSINSIY